MSDLVIIRAEILATMNGVANIGRVHDYERYATRIEDFKELFYDADTKLINGWWFDRLSTAELDGDTGEVRRIHTWQFYGFRGLQDGIGSAKDYQILIDAICDAFRDNPTLDGAIDDNKNMDLPRGPVGIQVDAVEPVMFFKILCHRAKLTLLTETTEPK